MGVNKMVIGMRPLFSTQSEIRHLFHQHGHRRRLRQGLVQGQCNRRRCRSRIVDPFGLVPAAAILGHAISSHADCL